MYEGQFICKQEIYYTIMNLFISSNKTAIEYTVKVY